MNRDKLKRLVEGVEAIEQSIKDLSKSKRDLFAANAGEFDPKAVRKIIARRRMKDADRQTEDDLVAQYEVALGMAGNLAKEAASGERTYEEAAEAAGVSRRTMARQIARAKAVPKATDNDTDHDPATGEVHEVERAEAGPIAEAATDGQGAATGPLDTDADTLEIPPFLRRVRAA